MKFFTNMFESWFKRKFISKCKSNIDWLLMRIEMITRRRKAMLKYLRSDIGELLRNGLGSEAYGRVGQSYLEQNRLLCYDFIEQFCMVISNHLVAMNEQSECPEECKEAVASLIYAAARFGDLPELRELRSLFFERYKDSLESFVNKEFVNLLKPEHPTKDTKTRLMQEIAFEYGVEWDSKSLEQNLYKLPSSDHDRSHYANDDRDNEYRLTNHDENGWNINIQETFNEDINDRKKDESNDDIEKQTENMRQRLLDFWSRTASLISTSRETTTSPEDSSSSSSSSSDDSTKSKPFFGFKFTNGSNKKRSNSSTSSDSFTNKQKRVKSHSTQCLPNLEGSKGHTRGVSYQPDFVASPPTRHVHPNLPNYDDIKARFAALRAKS